MATTMYKRLGSARTASSGSLLSSDSPPQSPRSSPSDEEDPSDKKMQHGRAWLVRPTRRGMVICMVLGTIAMVVLHRFIMDSMNHDGTSARRGWLAQKADEIRLAAQRSSALRSKSSSPAEEAAAVDDAEAQEILNGQPLTHQESQDAEADHMENAQAAEELRLAEAALEAQRASLAARDSGPEDGAPKAILVETNDKSRSEAARSVVNWDEMLAEAPTRRAQVQREWGIDASTPFFTLDEFKAMVGHTCPALRHCSVKQANKVFYAGGAWTATGAPGEDGSPGLVWNPHNCWLYQFTGDEVWVRDDQALQRLVVFLDGDTGSAFAEAAQMSDLFHHLEVPQPLGLQAQEALEARLAEFVESKAHAPNVAVTIVVNWSADKGREIGFARLLLRLGSRLAVESVNVVWTTQPFFDLEQSTSAIKTNEATAKEIRRVLAEKQNALFVRRALPGPKGAALAGLKGAAGAGLKGAAGAGLKGSAGAGAAEASADAQRFTIKINELKQQAAKYVLVDVRNDNKPFEEKQLQYFNRYSVHLPLLKMQNGWAPNLHLDTKIVVFCSSGANANKAVRILRQHGYKNARAMAVGSISPDDMATEPPAPIQLYNHVSLSALDMFAPTLGAPANTARPGSSSLTALFLGNAVLNSVFKNEIVAAAQGTDKGGHICSSPSACSSCFCSIGNVPSNRINFQTIATYFTKRQSPHKITLTSEHKIWEGDWVTFLNNNKETELVVRKNYSTVRTRKFERQALPDYLQNANIVAKTADGSFRETNEAPPHDPNALPVYAGNNKLDKAAMEEYDFRYPEWVRQSSFQRPSMWLGPKGSLSSLHCDHTNKGNLAYQVLGSKRWHLFPPRNRPFMYGKKAGVVIWAQLIDPNDYNRERAKQLPAFKMGLPESIILDVGPGEMLYNPDEWWHVVYNSEASLMLNFWLKASANILPPKA